MWGLWATSWPHRHCVVASLSSLEQGLWVVSSRRESGPAASPGEGSVPTTLSGTGSRPTSSSWCRGSVETVRDDDGVDSVPALLLPCRDSGPAPSSLGVGSGRSAAAQGAVEGGRWVTHSHHILLEGRECEKIR